LNVKPSNPSSMYSSVGALDLVETMCRSAKRWIEGPSARGNIYRDTKTVDGGLGYCSSREEKIRNLSASSGDQQLCGSLEKTMTVPR